jgi:subtilase family serine protease
MTPLPSSRSALVISITALLLGACATIPLGLSKGQSNTQVTLPQGVRACSGVPTGRARCQAIVRPGAHADSSSSGWTPADLQSAYDLPSATKGKGQIVAIVDAYDNPNVASDLATYRSTFKLPKANFTKYNQDGEQGDYPKGSPDWGVEIDNDVEMVSASCPKCEIYLVEANSNEWSDIETAQAEAVTLGAHIVSNSFDGIGASQSYWETPGVQYVASSGDDGYGLYDPAAFPAVVAVGGTVLVKGGGGKRGWTDSVWSESGGCATGEKPPWQHDKYAKSCDGRLGNDVSAVADGVAIYDTYDESGWVTVDGTQIGAPLLAGVFGLAGNATKQDGGRTFWLKLHRKYLNKVVDDGKERRFSKAAGWGTPDGIGAF